MITEDQLEEIRKCRAIVQELQQQEDDAFQKLEAKLAPLGEDIMPVVWDCVFNGVALTQLKKK